MSCRTSWLCIIVALSLCVPGCGLMQSTRNLTRESMKSMKMRPNDYRDPTVEVEDEWKSVSRTASTVRGVEKESDQWLRKKMLSPKAISIERSLGIE